MLRGESPDTYIDKQVKRNERYHHRALHADDALSILLARDVTVSTEVSPAPFWHDAWACEHCSSGCTTY